MSDSIRLSIVTVCRNDRAGLQRTIDSVRALTDRCFEYIVVDGASTDGSTDVIRANSDIIDRWVSEPDGGIYDAMNKGARMASGRWVIFMNAGDAFASPDVLDRIFAADFAADTAVIYGDVAKADGRGGITVKPASEPRNSHRMFFCHQSALTRRDLLLSHPFDTAHRMSADFKFFKTLIVAGHRFVHVPVAVALFDTGGVSNTRRSAGLADNIRVICEVDRPSRRMRLLPRIFFTYIMCKLRGK